MNALEPKRGKWRFRRERELRSRGSAEGQRWYENASTRRALTRPQLDIDRAIEVRSEGAGRGNAERCPQELRQCRFLPEPDVRALCDIVRGLLIEEANVQPVSSPVTVCGDIHGQLWDVLELLNVGGDVPGTSYIFMVRRAQPGPGSAPQGDFVDRGHYSLETFSILLALKARWPSRVTLLRGNHESRQITQAYGFYGARTAP